MQRMRVHGSTEHLSNDAWIVDVCTRMPAPNPHDATPPLSDDSGGVA
ncbi:hypothetical protein [Curtobacterium sp. ISL-83]|nr:hypothetical protein [Curtobacterium sp. ISL-83]MBT2503159.1 hypothetical protein [Curtobacterium sp. ISL-83]